MASPSPSKKSTGQFMKQGQTAGVYGNDPSSDAKGGAGAEPRELNP